MRRRSFIKGSTALAAVASVPRFGFAQVKGSDRLKIGLIGCGGRGKGAAENMVCADKNIKFVAFADLFPDKLEPAVTKLSGKIEERYPGEAKDILDASSVKKFSGWSCVDELLAEDIDVVIDASPPVFRTPHFEKIVEAGKHAFLEKPACVDVTQARKMLELADKAAAKGLSVVCGTQRRYHEGYRDVVKRVQDGAIGDILAAQCYWNDPNYVGHGQHDYMEKMGVLKGLEFDDMEYQIRNWFSFIWTSGDHIVEQHVHNIDVILWALGDNRLPVEVNGLGGRSTDLPSPMYGDRFSHFAVDYDMGDGLHMASYCHQDPKCSTRVFERVVGTKGVMTTAMWGKTGIGIYDLKGKLVHQPSEPSTQALEMEHKFLLDSVRNGTRVNTLKTLVNSCLVAIAGRMSAFSGQIFKYGWVLAKSQEDLAPKEWKFGKKAVGSVPVPGKTKLV